MASFLETDPGIDLPIEGKADAEEPLTDPGIDLPVEDVKTKSTLRHPSSISILTGLNSLAQTKARKKSLRKSTEKVYCAFRILNDEPFDSQGDEGM